MPQDLMEIGFEPPLGGVAGDLFDMSSSIKSLSKPLKDSVREVLIPAIARHFDEQPDWPALAEATVAQRAFYGYDADAMLVRTGRLKQAATQQNIWNIKGGYLNDETSAEIGAEQFLSRVPYGALQNFGGWSGMGGSTFVPARPFLFMEESEEDAIEAVFVRYLAARLAAKGFVIGSLLAGI